MGRGLSELGGGNRVPSLKEWPRVDGLELHKRYISNSPVQFFRCRCDRFDERIAELDLVSLEDVHSL